MDDWIEIPNLPSSSRQYAKKFKYRIWLTRYMMSADVTDTLRPTWLSVLRRESDGDLWLWEDADEEYIKALGSTGNNWRRGSLQIYEEDWIHACNALEAGLARSQVNPLAHLQPEARVRLIAWLFIAGFSLYEDRWREEVLSLDRLIQSWGTSPLVCPQFQHSVDNSPQICGLCHVSSLLPAWLETMLQVYSTHDLWMLPWEPGCACYKTQLSLAMSAEKWNGPDPQIPANSAMQRVLHELMVPPWPLILWVVFRTTMTLSSDPLQAFLSILRNPESEIFAWDDDDNSDFVTPLLQPKTDRPWLYPDLWSPHLVEVGLEGWEQIRKLSWREVRQRQEDEPKDMRIRIATLFSSFFTCALEIDIAPTLVEINNTVFASVADFLNGSSPSEIQPLDPRSEELPNMSRVKDWLEQRDAQLCHSVWFELIHMDIFDRMQCTQFAFAALPQNLIVFTYSNLVKRTISRRVCGILDWIRILWKSRTFLESLATYKIDVEALVQIVHGFKLEAGINSEHVKSHINRDEITLVAKLVLFLRDPESYKRFCACRGREAQGILDLLQELLDNNAFVAVRPLLCKALLRLSRSSGLYPQCFTLPQLEKVGQQVASGGFGDIWKGRINDQCVSIKIMRLSLEDDISAVLKEFGREASIWRQLSHPNLLPVFGMYKLDKKLCLVSPWMENGNVLGYLKQGAVKVDRFSLILDVARGLRYLHEHRVVHGDLKAVNILVTPSLRACIADFGLASVIQGTTVDFTHSTPSIRGGTARYLSPELFRGERPHFESDIYAFACVGYEILTGHIPFYEIRGPMAVMFKVMDGERPSRPDWCSGIERFEYLWLLLETCWQEEPDRRPTAGNIAQSLEGPPIHATTISSSSDWDEKSTSKFRRSLQNQSIQLLAQCIEEADCNTENRFRI